MCVKQVGRYRIIEEIGRGATGVVYKAVDPKLDETVALKVIRPDAENRRPSALETLRAITRLSHPNIAVLYDVLSEEQDVYLPFEYAPGISLETMLRRLALPEKPVLLHCFRQVAQALDYADTKGFVHRDVKPSNIIIHETAAGQFTAKVTDFGVSQLVSHGITGGVMAGTPSYLSPEEIQGTAVDGRSDQFSLAVVVYEALSGTKPFIADSLSAIFYQICRQAPRPVEEINPSLTAAVGVVLNRALAKNPSQRFHSCADFVEALGTALQETAGWVALPVAVPQELPPPRTSRQVLPESESSLYLPSLPKRRGSEEDEDTKKKREHSPLTLLAVMLALSAVVIAVTVLFGQWDWRSVFSRPTAGTASTETSNRARSGSAERSPAPPQDQPKQTQPSAAANEAPKPVDANPVTGPPPVLPPTKAPQPAKQVPNLPSQPGKSSPVPGAVAAVDLLSEPPGAKIVVDGNPSTSCVAPCTISLPTGRHTATFELNGYNLARRVFNVPDERSLITPLGRSTGTLVVTSTPAGSDIFVDNKPAGKTPATLHLPAGRHTLILVNGPMRHQETLDIGAGELATRSLRWQ
jgi:serine/threonine protein kinase